MQKLDSAFHNRMAQLPPRPSERTIKETLKEFKSKDKKSVVVNMTAFLLDGSCLERQRGQGPTAPAHARAAAARERGRREENARRPGDQHAQSVGLILCMSCK